MSASLWILSAALLGADVEFPKVLDDRLQLQLVAAEPDVRTPTGIAVDDKGRVLVVESHTHFRPPGYQGPAADRILLLDDFDPATGQARKISTFFEGTTHTMNLQFAADGSLYVATRMEIFRLRDKDGDGKSDERTEICHLDTPGNYPHNGLSGMAFDFAGNLYFGFGENLGADYKLIGSDSVILKGGGEGGNVYCCTADGKNIRRVATGFWNPFGLCIDAFGRLFCVDNDPDSRPPCRLLHVVEGGDYGFKFRNGRKGVHPFTAWNGELPGTLPMVSGTGEAPSAVMPYESDNLPEEYRGDLLVTSWGDHRLERYRLRPRGASFAAEMTTVLLGNQNFRPVGLALAPDGSLLMSDWVDKSYPLHNKGRVWRLSAKRPPPRKQPKDEWEAVASLHRPTRDRALAKLRREKLDSMAAYKIMTDAKQEDVQVAAGRLLAIDNLYARGLLMGLIASHPSPNVRQGLVDHLALAILETNSNLPRRQFDQFLDAPLESTVMTLRGEHTRNRGLSQLARFSVGFRSGNLYPDVNPDQKYWDEVRSDPFLLHAMQLEKEFRLKPLQNQPRSLEAAVQEMDSPFPEVRLSLALAAWKSGAVPLTDLMAELLADRDPRIQLVGLLWLAESPPADGVKFRPRVESLLKRPRVTKQVFEVAIATLDVLDGARRDAKNEPRGDDFIFKLLRDDATPAEIRRLALRSLSPAEPALKNDLLAGFLTNSDAGLRLEAIRTIRQRPDAERWPQLREIAASGEKPVQERCEAILGLSPGNSEDRKLLFSLTCGENAEVAAEALRAIRGFDLTADEKQQLSQLTAKLAGAQKELAERALLKNPPKDLPKHEDSAAWLKLAEGEGNPQAGERIFYAPRVGGCYRCHEFEGRGERVGPDLSTISRALTRERLVQSIVEPSREIAPQFTNYTILLKSGEILTGIHTGDEVDGRMKFADQNGRVFFVHPNDIDRRQPSNQSIMPAGLADNLTPQELRDLIAFLLRK